MFSSLHDLENTRLNTPRSMQEVWLLFRLLTLHPDIYASDNIPGLPGNPFSPEPPGCPFNPLSPGTPERPGKPESPFSPFLPGTPDGPGSPSVPGIPKRNREK